MDNTNVDYIINTRDYTLAVQPQKNRVYCRLKADAENAPRLLELYGAWAGVESRLGRHYTLLLDSGIERFQHPALIGFLLNVQKVAVAGGVHKIAEVLSGSDFAFMLHMKIAQMAGTEPRRKVFAEYEDAENWLDSFGNEPALQGKNY